MLNRKISPLLAPAQARGQSSRPRPAPAAEIGERLAARRFERCRMVVEGSLQLSRWEQQGGPPHPRAAELTATAFARLAEPI